jgi:hypothetical protein
VICHRSEDDGSSVLAAVRGAGTGDGRQRDITVGALDDADAMALLAEIAPGPADQARARAIVRDCGGSPFFLTELARARDIGDAAVLRVDRVLQGHVDRLPAEARALLQLCSLAARPLATDLAVRAAGLDREGAAVATLRAERLVRIRWAGASQRIEP